MLKRIELGFDCEMRIRIQATAGGVIGPGDPWRAGEPLRGLPFDRRLPGSKNSCIIGEGEKSMEGGEMVWQSAEKSKNIRDQSRIFPRCVWKMPPAINDLSGYLSTGGRVTGASARIFNTWRFSR